MRIRLITSKSVLVLTGLALLGMASLPSIHQHLMTTAPVDSQVTETVNAGNTHPELWHQDPEHTKPKHNISAVLHHIRLCSQQERIEHIRKVCQERYDVSQPALMGPAGLSLVDFKHNLTLCWMSKAGCTSLKAFIHEASGLDLSKYKQQEDSLNFVHELDISNKYGLWQMHQLLKKKQLEVVESFSNFMGIRHPFDRLVAYYRDKIVDTDRLSNHPDRVKEILQEFRSEAFRDNHTLTAMKWPQDDLGPPTFGEFLAWAFIHRVMDKHWNFITHTCHPCAHDWSAILRVETMDTDGRLLADILNRTQSGIPVRHSHQYNTSYHQFGKHLELFREVPDIVIEYFLEFYRTDMIMFGYKWDRETNTAYCSIDTHNGPCC